MAPLMLLRTAAFQNCFRRDSGGRFPVSLSGVLVLLLGGLHICAYKGIQINKRASREEEAAEAHKDQESNRPATQQTQGLHHQTENQDGPRKLQLPFEGTCADHQSAPFQNFASFKLPTSWTTAWQPLETQDTLFALTAGSKSGSAACTAPSSKERAPAWQCKHSRLLYGS